jgi:hypothetical protein
MLAFNLGIFFRNLKDAAVDFTAGNAACQVEFTGQVQALSDQLDLTRHLAVTLRRGDLLCHIAFDEGEDEEGEEKQEEATVDVRLVLRAEEGEQVLVQSRFRFDEISLKPHTPEGPRPPLDPAQAA